MPVRAGQRRVASLRARARPRSRCAEKRTLTGVALGNTRKLIQTAGDEAGRATPRSTTAVCAPPAHQQQHQQRPAGPAAGSLRRRMANLGGAARCREQQPQHAGFPSGAAGAGATRRPGSHGLCRRADHRKRCDRRLRDNWRSEQQRDAPARLQAAPTPATPTPEWPAAPPSTAPPSTATATDKLARNQDGAEFGAQVRPHAHERTSRAAVRRKELWRSLSTLSPRCRAPSLFPCPLMAFLPAVGSELTLKSTSAGLGETNLNELKWVSRMRPTPENSDIHNTDTVHLRPQCTVESALRLTLDSTVLSLSMFAQRFQQSPLHKVYGKRI
jgi:hypothetical protein